MKRFAICQCYFERNIYIKDYNIHLHLNEFNKSKTDMAKELNISVEELGDIKKHVDNEVNRRREQSNSAIERRKFLKDHYVPRHPYLLKFSEKFIDRKFFRIRDKILCEGLDEAESDDFTKYPGNFFSFPILHRDVCDALVEEIKHYEKSPLPKNPPNTMNKYGVNLDELGFESFVTELRERYVSPLAKSLYPEWCGDALDSHKAFAVVYKDTETDLGYHYDNAEVTLNVALNDSYDGGDIYFGPMRSQGSSRTFGYSHKKGHALLHRGQQLHGALPITDGERYNMIIWMRSSSIRNKLCPMCDQKPTLEKVDSGFGDGFTLSEN